MHCLAQLTLETLHWSVGLRQGLGGSVPVSASHSHLQPCQNSKGIMRMPALGTCGIDYVMPRYRVWHRISLMKRWVQLCSAVSGVLVLGLHPFRAFLPHGSTLALPGGICLLREVWLCDSHKVPV